jgi:hypothetical protein
VLDVQSCAERKAAGFLSTTVATALLQSMMRCPKVTLSTRSKYIAKVYCYCFRYRRGGKCKHHLNSTGTFQLWRGPLEGTASPYREHLSILVVDVNPSRIFTSRSFIISYSHRLCFLPRRSTYRILGALRFAFTLASNSSRVAVEPANKFL